MIKTLILLCLFVIATPVLGFSRLGESFGPVITYAVRQADVVRIFYYTPKSERGSIFVSNQNTNFTIRNRGSNRLNFFRLRVKNIDEFYYHIVSDDKNINGRGGVVRLPSKNNFRFALTGDTMDSFDIHEKLAERMKKHNPNFVIIAGDMVRDSVDMREWGKLFNSGSGLYHTSAFVPVIGNHDTYTPLWRQLFDVSNSRYPYYSYALPGVYLIVLNSEMYFGKDSVQYRWFEDELQRAEKDDWIIVTFHRPPFSALSPRGNNENNPLYTTLVPMLEQHNAHLILNGHNHIYERSHKENQVYITSGGSARNLHRAGTFNPYRQFLYNEKNHYVIFDVTPNAVTINAYNIDGRRIDNYTIRK